MLALFFFIIAYNLTNSLLFVLLPYTPLIYCWMRNKWYNFLSENKLFFVYKNYNAPLPLNSSQLATNLARQIRIKYFGLFFPQGKRQNYVFVLFFFP